MHGLSPALDIAVDPRPATVISGNSPLDFCEGTAIALTANPRSGLTCPWLMTGVPLRVEQITKTSN